MNKTIYIISILFFTLIFSSCQEDCETEYSSRSRRWENLPVPVRSDDVDYDLISEAIDIFNTAIETEAFVIDDNSDGFVVISYADLTGNRHGEAGVLANKTGFIDYAAIQIDANLSDEFAVETLVHELGHALGMTSHQDSGIMYCYHDGGEYTTDEEWYDAFELLRGWFSETYE